MNSAHRSVCLLAMTAAVCLSLPAFANEGGGAVYQRNRQYAQHGGWGYQRGTQYDGRPYGGGAYFAPSVVAGNWYARPYPYHFDYFRWRYNMPPVAPQECPCAEAPLPR